MSGRGAFADPASAGRRQVVATDISAQPAVEIANGFRLLVLRQFPRHPGPAAFGVVEQGLMRSPLRPSRHGLAFAIAFRPEIVAWLSDALGRPSLHDSEGRPYRNPRWPRTDWAQETRLWPDGTETLEWCVEATFPEEGPWHVFKAHWRARLAGSWKPEAPPPA